jgi:hypothetical protein
MSLRTRISNLSLPGLSQSPLCHRPPLPLVKNPPASLPHLPTSIHHNHAWHLQHLNTKALSLPQVLCTCCSSCLAWCRWHSLFYPLHYICVQVLSFDDGQEAFLSHSNTTPLLSIPLHCLILSITSMLRCVLICFLIHCLSKTMLLIFWEQTDLGLPPQHPEQGLMWTESQSAQAAITKHHSQGGFSYTLSQFWKLEIQDHGRGFILSPPLLACAHMTKVASSPVSLLIRALTPSWGPTLVISSNPNYPLNTHLLILSHWRLGLQHTNIKRIQTLSP